MKKDRISSVNYVGDDIIEQVKKYSYKLYSINNYNYTLLIFLRKKRKKNDLEIYTVEILIGVVGVNKN